MKLCTRILVFLCWMFLQCKNKEGPYRVLLLANQGPLTEGPNHLVQRFRPQGDQPKELFSPNEGGNVQILPDEQGFFVIGKNEATLVNGNDQYAPVSLSTKDRALLAAVMPKLGVIQTITQTGLLENWQWDQLLSDTTTQLPLKPEDMPIDFALFSPKGDWLITLKSESSIAKIWNLGQNKLSKILSGASEQIKAATFRQSNDAFLLGSLDGSAYSWTFFNDQWNLSQILPNHPQGVHSVAFSHQSSNNLALIGDGSGGVWVWDLSIHLGRLKRKFSTHQVAVESVAFSPDDQTLISCASDGSVVVKPNDPEISTKIRTVDPFDGFIAAALSPKGDYVVTTRYQKKDISLWSIAQIQDPQNPSTTPITTFSDSFFGNKAPSGAAAFSADGKWFATGYDNGFARVWNLPNRDLLPNEIPFQGPALMGHTGPIRSVGFSPDMEVVLTASTDQTARLWSRSSGQPLSSLMKHTNELTQALFSWDGLYVVTTSKDHLAILWDVTDKQNPKFLSQLEHPTIVNGATFSPVKNQLITVAEDGFIRLWNIDDKMHPILQSKWFGQAAGTSLFRAAFTPDGQFLFTSGANTFAFIWDMNTQTWDSSSIPHEFLGTNLSVQIAGNMIMTAGNFFIILQNLQPASPGFSINLQ